MLHFLLGILFVLVIFELVVNRCWLRYHFFARIVRVDLLQDVQVKPTKPLSSFKERILSEPWLSAGDLKQRYLGALSWVVNSVKSIAPGETIDPISLLNSIESGKGAGCSGMAIIYQNVLSSIGLPSRIVSLQRNLFDTDDTHTTVEVPIDGKWVIVDPTFNVSFTDSNGRLLSAQEVKTRILEGRHDDIDTIHYGESTYPARIENYYISYPSLFNNVFVTDYHAENLFAKILGKLPIFRYWYGPKTYYEKSRLQGVVESDAHLKFMQRVYTFFVIILPIITVAIAILISMQVLVHLLD